MSIIITDTGFGPETSAAAYVSIDQIAANAAPASIALDLASDTDPESLAPHVGALASIRIDFPSFADGRGFTIARRLRELGFAGKMRARGHLIADQYAMARRSGFDEVEISDDLAARQPEDQWLARADWAAHDYQSRLRG